MKITIESTSRIVEANGVTCRVWEGKTERGVPVIALIPRVTAKADQDCSQFEKELHEVPPVVPSDDAIAAFPLRMLIA